MVIRPASDTSFLVDGATLSADAFAGMPGLVNVHPAYASTLVEFDPRRIAPDVFETALRVRVTTVADTGLAAPRVVEVPVRYGGLDLEDVARHAELTPSEVVRLHAGTEYTVRFLGFAPGFAYLDGLPERLWTPRLGTPRRLVPAGSVAIGGSHTGVYPMDLPGGWRIIGQTDVVLFDAQRAAPSLLQVGDRVRFVEVGG